MRAVQVPCFQPVKLQEWREIPEMISRAGLDFKKE
tara:strand:- start:49 stop:153 length:105 start_codon:yes stop_codon:yes gene_type:complete